MTREAGTSTLTAEQVTEFDQTGVLILRNVLSEDTVERLVADGDRLIGDPATPGRQQQGSGEWDSIRNCIGKSAEVRRLIAEATVLSAIVELMGPNLRITTSHLIYRHPDPPGSRSHERVPDWHRDIPRVTTDLGFAATPRLQVKAAYSLSDLTSADSGGTVVLPGSHLLKRRPAIPACTDPPEAWEPSLRKGDCMLFENRVMHAGAHNRVGRVRKSLMIAYGFRWLAPADYRRQSEEHRAGMSDVERFLVGESPDSSSEFVVGGSDNPLEALYGVRNSASQQKRAK